MGSSCGCWAGFWARTNFCCVHLHAQELKESCILVQQDNDPKHTSQVIKERLNQARIEVWNDLPKVLT